MIQPIFNHLYEILVDVSVDCQNVIKPNNMILESTEKGSLFHFKVPNSSRKQIIAWGNIKISQSRRLGKDEPCVVVSIDAVLLDDTNTIYKKNYYPNAHYGRDVGEVKFAISQVGSSDYKLAVKALIEASSNLISGETYGWKNE